MKVLNWLRWFFGTHDRVTTAWLKSQDRHESSRGVEQAAIQFPITKFKNEHALFQTWKLRQGAPE